MTDNTASAEAPPPRQRSRPQPEQDTQRDIIEVPGHRGRPPLHTFVGRPLSPDLDDWNLLARHDTEMLYEIKRGVEERLWTFGLALLRPGEVAVLSFIMGRTFRFRKYVERIPERTFDQGVVNQRTGEVVTAGLRMDRGTIRRHLAGLVERRWVQRWDVRTGARALPCYMPLTEEDLLETLIKSGGCVPHVRVPTEERDIFRPGEIVAFEGEDSWGRPGSQGPQTLNYVRHKVGSVASHMVVRRIERNGDDLPGRENLFVVRSADCRAITPRERREHLWIQPVRGVELVDFPGEDGEFAEALQQQAIDEDSADRTE